MTAAFVTIGIAFALICIGCAVIFCIVGAKCEQAKDEIGTEFPKLAGGD